MRVFVNIAKEALSNRRIRLNIKSLVFVKELSISLTVLKRMHFWLLDKEELREKCVFVSTLKPHEQNGFRGWSC